MNKQKLFVYKRLQAVFISLMVTAVFSITMTVQAQEPELLIDSVVSPENPYIQQPFQYTLRLWRRSHLQQGYFLKPDIPDAILLEDKASEVKQVKKNGLDYELLEQRYVLIAQKSGALQLPEPVFSSREIFIKGKSLRLNIKPQPEAFAHENWLIAKSITTEQNWLFPESITVGDPVERTIIISGTGITGAQLPKLQLSANGLIVQNFFDNARHSVKKGEVFGHRLLKFRYIANQPGHYSIPEITLLWWNSQTGQIEKERIAGKLLLIEPATSLDSTTLDKRQGFVTSAANFPQSWSAYKILSRVKHFQWQQGLTLFIIALLTLALVILTIKYKRSGRLYFLSRTIYQSKFHKVYWRYKLQRALLKACDQNDYYRVKSILLQWAKMEFTGQSFSNLIALSEMTENKTIIATLSDIDQCLYGNTPIKKMNTESKLCLVSFMRGSKKADFINRKPLQLPELWPHRSK